MCGIAGMYDSRRAPNGELLQLMADAIAHRGPDGEGFEVFNSIGVALAHRRLSIIDVSERGRQPMFDSSGRYCIVYNGELYNYKALRLELEAKGYRFHSDTDTEVVVCAYAEFGEKCLARFNGEFAFCIVDVKAGTLFFARDPFGVKPLYYFWGGGSLVFASEIKAILRAPFVPTEVCSQSVADYLAYGFSKAPRTLFNHIHTLPAGHKMLLSNGNLTISEYWRWQAQPRDWNERDAFEALNSELDRSVQRKLVSDVPIGTFLSGGVDSSLVSHYASRHHKALNTFSIGFLDPRKDESAYAKEAAARIGSNHHVFYCDRDILNSLYRISWHLDEPFSDFSALPTYFLAQKTRERVTVALSGDASDELLSGYAYHRWLHLLSRASRLPQPLLRGAAPVLSRLAKNRRDSHTLARLARLAHYAIAGRNQFIRDRYQKFSDTQIASLLAGSDYSSPDAALRHDLDAHGENGLIMLDIKYGLEQDMLVKVDRMAMANSLEVRIPFLDMELVNLIQSLPETLKVRQGEPKYLLKKVAASHLGNNIVYREKKGFSAPLDMWMNGEFGKLVGRHVFSDESSLGEVLDRNIMRQILRPSGAPTVPDMTQQLYQLVSLDIWLKNVSQNRMKEALVG